MGLIKHGDPKIRGVSIDASTLAAALAPEIAALIVGKLTGLVALGDDAILGEEAAAQALNKSQSTMEAWRAKGMGPKWVKLGPRAVGYRVGDLRQFIRDGRARSFQPSLAALLSLPPAPVFVPRLAAANGRQRASARLQFDPRSGRHALKGAAPRSGSRA